MDRSTAATAATDLPVLPGAPGLIGQWPWDCTVTQRHGRRSVWKHLTPAWRTQSHTGRCSCRVGTQSAATSEHTAIEKQHDQFPSSRVARIQFMFNRPMIIYLFFCSWELYQLTTKQLQISFSYLLNLGSTVVDVVDVTKRRRHVIKQRIFRSVCDLVTLSNISHGVNLRLPLDTQNTERPSALPPKRPLGIHPQALVIGSLALRAHHGIQVNPVRF